MARSHPLRYWPARVSLACLLSALPAAATGDHQAAPDSSATPEGDAVQVIDDEADKRQSRQVGAVKWMAKRKQFEIRGVPFGATGLPILYYSPNSGWNTGLRVQWLDYRRRPYRYKMTLYGTRSQEGRVSLSYRLKVPNISGTGFGVRMALSYKRDIRARYYGLGNDRDRDTDLIECRGASPVWHEADDETDERWDCPGNSDFIDEFYYLYVLKSPRLIVSLLRHIYGPASMSLSFGLETADVDRKGERSLYVDEGTPDGVVDGVSGFVGGALSWDSRDDEVMPRSGVFHEWSYETSRNSLITGLFFKEIDFQRYTFTDARYFSTGRTTLANRTVVEVLSGAVPLYAFGEIGGSRRTKGLGGSDSLRGFDRQRFTDNVRFFTNTEVRHKLHIHRIFKQYIEWHGVIFVDSGQVARDLGDLEVSENHYSAGVGVRMLWNADFVIRGDVGLSSEQGYLGLKYRNLF